MGLEVGTYLSFQWIITTLAVVGSALSVYLSMKKIRVKIEDETTWKVETKAALSQLNSKVDQVIDEQKERSALVRELLDSRIKFEVTIKKLKSEQARMWTRLEENDRAIAKVKERH